MSDNLPNNTVRITPEQKLQKQINELIQQYLMTGGNIEFILGSFRILGIFYEGPARANSQRQAEAMLQAKTQAQVDAQNPRQQAG